VIIRATAALGARGGGVLGRVVEDGEHVLRLRHGELDAVALLAGDAGPVQGKSGQAGGSPSTSSGHRFRVAGRGPRSRGAGWGRRSRPVEQA